MNSNTELLELAVELLGGLADELVFTGGCVTGILLTDPAAPQTRATIDVDAISAVTNRAGYYRLSDRLRRKGFTEDSGEGAPVCRWRKDGIILDIIPADANVLGFGNQWFKGAFAGAVGIVLPSGRKIRVVTAPYFLACKLAAFAGRGRDDFVSSRDIEDIVAVLDGRPEIVKEVRRSPAELQEHLCERFQALLTDARFHEALPGHLPPDDASQARIPLILERMRKLAEPGRRHDDR